MVQINSVSKAEAVKQQSRQLRGHLARDLSDTARPFDNEGYSLLKFHGVYPRVRPRERDRAQAARRRQAVAIHGARPHSRRAAHRRPVPRPRRAGRPLRQWLTTLAACGEVVRTVTTSPAPLRDAVQDRLEADTRPL